MARKRKLEASTSADRSELRRLLEAAKADYWDDSLRLVIADWLEEHGGEADRARGEVIRLQLDESGGGPNWSVAVRRLRERHLREWVGPHRALFHRRIPECSRGLLAVSLPPEAWQSADGPPDEAWEWVETARPQKLTAALLPRFLTSNRMATVSVLDLTGLRTLTAPACTALAGLPPAVRRLRLPAVGARLADLGRQIRPGLEGLMVVGTDRLDQLAALFESERLAGLRSLGFHRWIGPEEMGRLTASPAMRGLRRLGLRGISPEDLSAVAGLMLRSLSVYEPAFRLDALARLSGSACASTLEELQLYGSSAPGRIRPLGLMPALPCLRRLALIDCSLDAAGVRELARGGLPAGMDQLDLAGNRIGAEGAAALTALPAGPRALRLAEGYLGDEGVARLAAWPGLSRVRFLDLSSNKIGGKGLLALAGSPHASSLEALDLTMNNTITGASFEALLDSPHGAKLRWLALPGNAAVANFVMALVARKPARLRELQMTGMSTSKLERLRTALPECAIG
jgi:uncharacterized protein (TIGR02996 family)